MQAESMKELKDRLGDTLKEAFNRLVEERQEQLLEKDLEEGSAGIYYEGIDRDFVNVGVGSVVVREDVIQDEVQAWEDAKEEIITELVNGDDVVENLFGDNAFTIALGQFLKGC